MDIQHLLIYRNFKYQSLFQDMALLLTQGQRSGSETMPDSYSCANRLIELASAYGFEGNLWHCFLALCAANHENAYSTACEIRGEPEGTLKFLAMNDCRILKELYDCDITALDLPSESGIWSSLSGYQAAKGGGRIFNKRIRDRILELSLTLSRARDAEEFCHGVTEFYREFGVGKYGLNKAFRIREEAGHARIEPIVNVEHVYLNDIIGYERQKEKLIVNTESFLRGGEANNVLLFGDAGTGKSSCIKAILNEYYDHGLRIIEVYKHQFHALSSVLEQVQDRNYKFIIYMDDLSFEESELEYKYLKAIIEGGLGRRPNNVLIYATSNRRHLIREKFSDKKELDDELHQNDTVQEKLSLVARFGVTIYFGSPDKKEFQKIVRLLAQKHQVDIPPERLYAEANVWELSHGGLSGRTAAQFITHLLGQEKQQAVKGSR